MKQYKDLLRFILRENANFDFRNDRTGVTTLSTFGYQIRFNLKEGFPAQTTKKLAWTAVVGELLWFLEGSNDERRLAELTHGAPRSKLRGYKTIWTANADNQGKALGYENYDNHKILGPVYGVQWRHSIGSDTSGEVDQITKAINMIKTDPNSRRNIVDAWQPSEIDAMALPPCHVLFQFYVKNSRLSCHMYQRSADAFLGVPFNIASYALLTHIIARECGLDVGDLIISFGDVHIYKNHIDQVYEVLKREEFPLPKLLISDEFDLKAVLEGKTSLDTRKMFQLENYQHHRALFAEMAV